jgi:putative membrane protein insertion efficiency factor
VSAGTFARSGARALAILPVRLYQLLVSPLFPGTCKYHPSCSQYAIDAISKHGVLRGSVKAAWRLLRCNPWSRGGVDYA